jgi:hypothetical protein
MFGPPEARVDDERREGCLDQAEFAVHARYETEAWDELAPLLSEIPERVWADPRSVEARRNWSQCMAEAGYQAADVDEAISLIDQRVWDVWVDEPPPPGAPEHRGLGGMDPWFVETEAWQELVQFELDLAAADTACSQDTDLFEEYYDRFFEDNQQLIEQLQAELADLEIVVSLHQHLRAGEDRVLLALRVLRQILLELGEERVLVRLELLPVLRAEVHRVLVGHVDARDGDDAVVVHLLRELAGELDRLHVRAERAAEHALDEGLDLLLDAPQNRHRNPCSRADRV